MAVATGLGSFCGHKTESSWGTAVTPDSGNYNRFVSQDFVPAADDTAGDESLGIAFVSGVRQYRKRCEGSVTFDSRYQGLDRWLLHLFGSGSDTITAGTSTNVGAHKHVYNLKAARPVGMTVEWHLELFKLVMAGLKLNSLRVQMGTGVQRLTFGGVAKAFATPTGSVNSSPTFLEDVADIVPVNALESGSPGTPGTALTGFSLRVGTAGTFAAPTSYCAEEPVELNIEAPMKTDDLCLGNPGLVEPTLNGKFAISGSFPRTLVDDDFLDFFATGSPVYLRLQYDGPGPIIVGGGWLYQFIWDIPYARIRKAGGPVSGAGSIIETVEFVAAPPSGLTADALALTVYNKLSANA